MIQTVTPTTEEASLVPSKTPQYTSHKAGTKATTEHSTTQLSLVPSVLKLSSYFEESIVTDVPSKTKAVDVQTLQSMEHSTIATSFGMGVISSVYSVERMTPTEYVSVLSPLFWSVSVCEKIAVLNECMLILFSNYACESLLMLLFTFGRIIIHLDK